jgi:hypothetical protein
VALVVNQDVTVHLSGEAASQPPTIQRVRSGSPPLYVLTQKITMM